jgi:hypothetical protein
MWKRDDKQWKARGCFGCLGLAAALFVGGLLLFCFLLVWAATR